ncbi:MAG: LytTR family DNA-binding domain-containing protein [Bacteroidota bacterium]
MTGMRCIIIEDEIHVANHLRYLLGRCNMDITVECIIGSVTQSISWLKANKTDLIFMDIQLEDGSSFSIFDHVQIDTPIIFTTSYDTYALEAFKRNGIAYLLKPIDQEDLEAALHKYSRWFLNNDAFVDLAAIASPFQKRFLVQLPTTLHSVEASEIAFFYVQNKQVFLVTKEGQKYPFDNTLELLEKRLNPDSFFRINRQFIIRRDAISEMHTETRGRVKIITAPQSKDEMIVSIDRAIEFKKWLNL